MQKGLTLLLLLCTALCVSQNVTLTGKVTDPDDLPLESATIYLTSVKDSTVIDYTLSDRNGNWEMRTRAKEETIDLKISFIGFTDYKQRMEGITEDKNFGTLKMSDRSTELSEVVIESEVPPIRIKSDTLEFNASSFKVRPDANVEALIKQLPGVEIDSDGKITVNGKEVNQILVNGKPFFDKDGKIALQNLPADIIEKVQVTDTKTKKEELTGQAASGNNASINLTIDEDKNKGFFGKFMGGYGTDDRYESSALVNYFKDKQKISVLASSNNINSTGFSMNEIFDNMGGGRNNNSYSIVNGIRNYGRGITTSNMVGINYADEWIENLDSNMSYFYTTANTENENRTKQVSYLTNSDDGAESSLTTESVSKTDDEQYAHNFNTQFEFKIDSTATIYFDPKFSVSNSKSRNTSQQATYNQDDLLLNDNEGFTFSDNDSKSFESSLQYNKSFKKSGRYFNVWAGNENKKDDGASFNKSRTSFYDNETGDITNDNRDQVRYGKQTADTYSIEIEYAEPITDSLKITTAVSYGIERNIDNRDGFNFDEATDSYTLLNDSITSYMSSKTQNITPEIGIEINKGKYSMAISGGPSISNFDNTGSYRGVDYTVNKKYILPSVDGYLSYRFTKSKSIYTYYQYSIDFPQASQVLPIEDVSNALSTRTGNADLDPNKSHYFYLSFNNFDYTTRSGYNFYGGGNIYDSRVVSTTEISNTAKSTITYTNVSGTYSTWFGGYWNKSIKKDSHKFRYNLGFYGNFDLDKGFTNGEPYEAKRLRITPRVNFTWDYGELLTINPSYSFSYNETNYTNYIIDAASYTTHRFNLETTSRWPNHFVFGNDFGYTYNSNLGDGFKRDFYLWNTSIGYNFLNDKLLFKVKVYDVLNQNLGTSRSITATSVYDQQNVVLKRYMMFSLTYKIEKFGGKKKEERINRWGF